MYSGLHQKLLAGGLHHKENIFQTFWAVVKLKNVFLTVIMTFKHVFGPFPYK